MMSARARRNPRAQWTAFSLANSLSAVVTLSRPASATLHEVERRHASTLAGLPRQRRLFPLARPSARPSPMNRTGIVIALAIGACVGVVFAVWPQLDIAISRLFFSDEYRVFPVQYSLVARNLRDLFTYMIAALVAPAFIAVAIKLVLPRRRMLIAARAALFLIAT